MATWREQLDRAQGWKEYRQALRTLREAAGIPFDKLPERSRDIARRHPHLRSYDSTNTFSQLLDKRLPDTQPEWHKVELVVRICAEHHGVENTTALVQKWADAYRRCGGDPGERFPPRPHGDSAPAAPLASVPDRTEARSDEREHPPTLQPAPPDPDPDPVPDGRPRRPSKPVLVTAAALVLVLVVLGSMKLGSLFTDGDNTTPPSDKAATPTPTGGVTGQPSAPPTSSASPSTRATTEQSTPTNTSPPGSPGVNATFAWSNDGGGGGSQSDIVKVASTYRNGEDPGQTWAFNRGDTLVVQCQVTGGRPIEAGTAYPGPAGAKERGPQGIWYRMTSPVQAWAPAVYVDTGRDSLPAC
ncbi:MULTISPECIES: hypothetical protein [unclassified Streptomyces]|uniref:hypothetical protein n=1 Tax=unclassified Streptomyces TaxID=2593676 RepID=UPI0035D6E3CB